MDKFSHNLDIYSYLPNSNQFLILGSAVNEQATSIVSFNWDPISINWGFQIKQNPLATYFTISATFQEYNSVLYIVYSMNNYRISKYFPI